MCGKIGIRKACEDCKKDFHNENESAVHFCEACADKVHKHPRRNNHRIGWCKEMNDLLSISELEL